MIGKKRSSAVVKPRTSATMPRSNSASGMRISKPRISKGVATTPGFKPGAGGSRNRSMKIY